MIDLAALAEQLTAELAALDGVETLYARRGLVAIAFDVVARAATGVAPGARVAVREHDGMLAVEANVGVRDDVSATVTATRVRDRTVELLTAAGLQAQVTVRVATIG